jgi:chemotaxis protein CheD
MAGIGEMVLSDTPGESLSAPNLGSCLGIAVYNPKLKLGGLIHCLLPLSKQNPEKAAKEPIIYVDTGVAELLKVFLARGAQKKDLIIAVAGGSNINDTGNVFEIGKKNYAALRKILWKNELLIRAEDIGGNHSRTITLVIDTGEVLVRSNNGTISLIERKVL